MLPGPSNNNNLGHFENFSYDDDEFWFSAVKRQGDNKVKYKNYEIHLGEK